MAISWRRIRPVALSFCRTLSKPAIAPNKHTRDWRKVLKHLARMGMPKQQSSERVLLLDARRLKALRLDGTDPAYEQWLRANENQERSRSNWYDVSGPCLKYRVHRPARAAVNFFVRNRVGDARRGCGSSPCLTLSGSSQKYSVFICI